MVPEMINVLVVGFEGNKVERRAIENTLPAFQEIVGGYIEPVGLGFGVAAYVNEDGLSMGLPHNLFASMMASRDIVGNMVVFGTTPEGDEADVPKWFADLAIEFTSTFRPT